MRSLEQQIATTAQDTGFSGVVQVDWRGNTEVALAYGYADRAFAIGTRLDTQLGTASATKTLTALTTLALVEQGVLALSTTARSLLGDDLPDVAEDVTVEHLLAHRSGIGDYLDEDTLGAATDYVMTVPVHQLVTAEDYLRVLGGHPTVFPAGERFAYNNGGYVVLALLSERASGVGYHELVRRCVLEPAGMVDTAFLRSDELPGRAARGYLDREGLRTNVLHLPVVGVGDGGAYTTTADLHRLWKALHAGEIIAPPSVELMLRPHGEWPEESRRYGLGLHLHETGTAAWLEGSDAGVSMTSVHDPSQELTWTVISNWTDGAWPLVNLLNEQLRL
ncbi:beta-lactamase family protein [Nocardioides sp. HDW12B]|uniref:serine hydrolase domain-containing protein n=1 Tax=Nocardioides sp. HDW12B TaxID=2714939 RepID=UPI00140C04F1|nr:serine hydrolase domain-containing protein [Nocardioides sp. HDW12B]QIK66266.1 beta-lactamase family protein [Nocardioides sp. HDW12B]